MNLFDIKQQALAEIYEEQVRSDINKAKEEIRNTMNCKRWWHKIIPFTIKIEWRTK